MFGFNIYPSSNTNTTNINFINCSNVFNKYIVQISNTATTSVSLFRIYYGLAYHQWVHLTIKYAVLDYWNGSTINI